MYQHFKKSRIPRAIFRMGFLILIYSFPLLPSSVEASNPAKIVSFRPQASHLDQNQPKNASIGMGINSGNVLLTGRFGNISILLPDYMILKMDENTEFQYLGPDKGGNNGVLRKGKVWLRGRSRDAQFGISSPTATATIRGTEWYMDVALDGTTTIGIIDGSVRVANEFGTVFLGAQESAVVKPGAAPVKTALIVTENAVNWILRYRPPWDKDDMRHDGEPFAQVIEKSLDAYHANDLAKAFAVLDESKPGFAKTPSWQALAGFLHLTAGKDQQAKEFFNNAAGLAPDWALPYAMLAVAAIVESNPAEARTLADKALKVQAHSALGMLAKALTLKADLKLDEAYAMSLKAVSQSPGFLAARLTAATIALENDDINACERLLEGVPPDGPYESEKLTLWGYASLREGYPAKALDRFRRAIALDPDEADAVMGEGIALFNLNRPLEGVEAMSKAALLSPRSSSFQSYLAKAFYELKRWEDAQQSLDRAKRLDPKDPTPYLYEAILKYAQNRPGEAVRELEKASSLNRNRAVFRSRFLLDQDSAVLTSNTARIYNDLVFPRASTLAAARALEINPADEGAHRMLYFALINDPRSYQQAAESELTALRHLAAPTRSGVIFDEGKVSAYQEMFDRAGEDFAPTALFFQSRDSASRTTQQNGAASLAVKTTAPLAVSLFGLRGEMETTMKSASSQSYPGYSMSTDMNMNQKLNTGYYNAFLKWRPTWSMDFFSDLLFLQTDTKSDTTVLSSMSFPGFPDFTTPFSTLSKIKGDTGSYKLGGRLKLPHDVQVLANYIQRDNSSDLSADSAISDTVTTRMSGDQKTIRRIAQAALWKTAGIHNFQFGARYSTGRDKMSNTTTYLPTDSISTFESGIKDETNSAYFHHQFQINENLRAAWALFAHDLRYRLEDSRSYSTTLIHPSVGVSWDITENWRARAAYIESLVGDRAERLQPVMLAAFPLVSANISDAYSFEEQLTLTHKTFNAGLDFNLSRIPLFCGVEVSLDRDESSRFTGSSGDAREDKKASASRVNAYLETLITNQLAGNMSYRFSEYEVPDKRYENTVEAGLAFFFPNGPALKLKAAYVERRPDSSESLMGKETLWIWEPLLVWNLLENAVKIEFKAHYEDKDSESTAAAGSERKHSFTWWTRFMATVYF